MFFKYLNIFYFFISLTYFTTTKCGNLSFNILKLFWPKKKKKGCHKREVHVKFFVK